MPGFGDVNSSCPVNRSHPFNAGLDHWQLAIPGRFGSGAEVRDLVSARRTTLASMTASNWKPTNRLGGLAELSMGSSSVGTIPMAPETGALTISVMAKLNSLSTNTTQSIITSTDGSGPTTSWGLLLGYRIDANGNAFFGCYVFDGVGTNLTSSLTTTANLQQWHLLTMGASNVTKKLWLWIDGVLSGSVAFNGTTLWTGGTKYVLGPSAGNTSNFGGTGTSANVFSGSFDDLRIYRRLLSSAEVTALYLSSLRSYPGPLNRSVVLPFASPPLSWTGGLSLMGCGN
jgi:hypothetical protein